MFKNLLSGPPMLLTRGSYVEVKLQKNKSRIFLLFDLQDFFRFIVRRTKKALKMTS